MQLSFRYFLFRLLCIAAIALGSENLHGQIATIEQADLTLEDGRLFDAPWRKKLAAHDRNNLYILNTVGSDTYLTSVDKKTLEQYDEQKLRPSVDNSDASFCVVRGDEILIFYTSVEGGENHDSFILYYDAYNTSDFSKIEESKTLFTQKLADKSTSEKRRFAEVAKGYSHVGYTFLVGGIVANKNSCSYHFITVNKAFEPLESSAIHFAVEPKRIELREWKLNHENDILIVFREFIQRIPLRMNIANANTIPVEEKFHIKSKKYGSKLFEDRNINNQKNRYTDIIIKSFGKDTCELSCLYTTRPVCTDLTYANPADGLVDLVYDTKTHLLNEVHTLAFPDTVIARSSDKKYKSVLKGLSTSNSQRIDYLFFHSILRFKDHYIYSFSGSWYAQGSQGSEVWHKDVVFYVQDLNGNPVKFNVVERTDKFYLLSFGNTMFHFTHNGKLYYLLNDQYSGKTSYIIEYDPIRNMAVKSLRKTKDFGFIYLSFGTIISNGVIYAISARSFADSRRKITRITLD